MSAHVTRRLTAAAAVLAVAVAGWLALDGDEGYRVTARFDDVSGLRKHSQVKISAVTAGTVKAIELTDDDRVDVTFQLKDNAAPIGPGASVKVRPVNLLGEKYADLDPGDVDRPLPSGARIPLQRTGIAVELDDVLNALDAPTRAGMRVIINEFGEAVTGNGPSFSRLLSELPPALDETEKVLGELRRERQTIMDGIASGERVLFAVHGRRDDLQDLVSSAAGALDVTARKRRELGETIRAAPGAMRSLRTTLGSLDRTARQLRPAARRLTAAAPPLASVLDRLPDLRSAAEDTLETAVEAAPDLRRLGRQGSGPVRRLQPTTKRLDGWADELSPVMQSLDEGGFAKILLRFMAGWADVNKHSDGLGHLFRVRAVLNEEALTHLVDRYAGVEPIDLTPTQRRSRRRPDPAPAPAATSTPTVPAAPAPARRPLIELPLLEIPELELPKVLPSVLREPVVKTGETIDALLEAVGLENLLGTDDPAASDIGTLLDYLLGP